MLIEIKKPNSRGRSAWGVTIIELLVVISIITVLTALMVPRLRMINKDRNIREAARVVGSLISSASQRAINDGAAGIVIERNERMIDADGVNYGVTTMYLMRRVPPYIGDSVGAVGEKIGPYVLEFDEPFEQADIGMVLVNDSISVNNGSVKYRILDVDSTTTAGKLRLTLSQGSRPALPGAGGDLYPFVVHRQPRKLDSSRIDMPEGYVVDMRYSGPLNPSPDVTGVLIDTPRSWFHEIVNPAFQMAAPENAKLARTTTIIFDTNGGIDRVYFYNPDVGGSSANGFIDSKILSGSLYLYVTDFEISPALGHSALASPSSLWVVVNNTTGGVNVAFNTPAPSYAVVPPGGDLGPRINDARGIARNSQSASQ